MTERQNAQIAAEVTNINQPNKNIPAQISSVGREIQDSGFKIQDLGFKIQDSRFKINLWNPCVQLLSSSFKTVFKF